MATTTTKLALTKPDGTDLVDIAVLNANADKIDAASGATICTSSTRPASPFNGQLIFETDTLNVLVYRTSTTSWNIVGGSTVASEPPAGAGNGNFWWDSDNGKLYIYYNDGNSSQWVSVMPSQTTVDVSQNAIINGGFDILQRASNTTITGSHFAYKTADRWLLAVTASGSTSINNSIIAFPDSGAIVDGINVPYFMRWSVDTLGTATAYGMINRIEDVRSLAGSTVTLSFYVKGTQTSTLRPVLIQYFGSGGSADTTTYPSGTTTTTFNSTWTRKTFTFTVPSVLGKTINANSFIQLQLDAISISAGTMDIAGVQLERGSVATSFKRAGGTLQGELAACQRYCCEPHGGYYLAASTFGDVQTAQSTAVTSGTVSFPVTMRAKPSMTIASGSDQFRLGYPGSFTISGISFNDASRQQAMLTVGSSGLTFGTGYHFYLQSDRSVPQLLFSAEL